MSTGRSTLAATRTRGLATPAERDALHRAVTATPNDPWWVTHAGLVITWAAVMPLTAALHLPVLTVVIAAAGIVGWRWLPTWDNTRTNRKNKT